MIPEYDELLVLAETLGEVKTKTEKLEAEFSTQARPLEAATNALSAALSGIKALQFHVLDNNLGALSARVEEMRKAVDEQVGVIALELKKADETNAAKAGADAEALRSEIVALQSQLGSLVTQFGQQLERVEFAAKEEAKKLQLIPGPAGAAGASLNPRGTFIDGETYNRLDVVSWLGSSYIATVDGVTEKPSKNSNQWQTLASRGGGGAGGVGDFGSLAGVAQINQGGTGQTTRVAALNALLPDQAGSTQYMLLTDGSGTVSWGAQPVAGLPSQTSNSGRLLTTNGSTASWSNAVTVSGSNATVGGTLTSNGSFAAAGSMVSTYGTAPQFSITPSGGRPIRFNASLGNISIQANSGGWFIGTQFLGSAGTLRGNIWAAGTDDTLDAISIGDGSYSQWIGASSTKIAIPLTTASNTTSSGALVVGNGTSGGLGVGGNVNIGGTVGIGAATDATIGVNSQPTLSTGSFQYGVYSSPTINASTADAGFFSMRTAASSTVGSAFVLRAYTPTLGSGSTVTTATGLRIENIGATGVTNAYGIDIAAQSGASSTNVGLLNAGTTRLTNTTASNNTSSGALVVSGGVGVAGAIYAGAIVDVNFAGAIAFRGTTTGTDCQMRLVNNGTSGRSYSVTSSSSGSTAGVGFHIWDETGAASALSVDASRNTTLGGSIKTAAPSGGTAAAWKLGTVATVSPTSPNRTIEVDIGGTIYYLAAKTTNN